MPTDGELSVGMGGTPGVVVGGLYNPGFGTLDVSTGSSRSVVASEEADVGVMFGGNVDIAGISVGSCEEFNCGFTDHWHCMPVVGAGGGYGEAIGNMELVDSSCFVNPKKGRSLIGTKDGQDGWTSEQRYAEH